MPYYWLKWRKVYVSPCNHNRWGHGTIQYLALDLHGPCLSRNPVHSFQLRPTITGNKNLVLYPSESQSLPAERPTFCSSEVYIATAPASVDGVVADDEEVEGETESSVDTPFSDAQRSRGWPDYGGVEVAGVSYIRGFDVRRKAGTLAAAK